MEDKERLFQWDEDQDGTSDFLKRYAAILDSTSGHIREYPTVLNQFLYQYSGNQKDRNNDKIPDMLTVFPLEPSLYSSNEKLRLQWLNDVRNYKEIRDQRPMQWVEDSIEGRWETAFNVRWKKNDYTDVRFFHDCNGNGITDVLEFLFHAPETWPPVEGECSDDPSTTLDSP